MSSLLLLFLLCPALALARGPCGCPGQAYCLRADHTPLRGSVLRGGDLPGSFHEAGCGLISPNGLWYVGVDYYDAALELRSHITGRFVAAIATGDPDLGPPIRVAFNNDAGRLEMWQGLSCACDFEERLVWYTPTFPTASFVHLDDTGQLGIYDSQNRVLWAWNRNDE
jgi:hypothetical protein